ncbi:Tumor necrosis factor receptor superfamily member 19 OS=Ureibacillus acetophenoni OX=614649 GN=SAMN05877842_11196 PE=4 SV=1 [Ureibacillus acetophenoni]
MSGKKAAIAVVSILIIAIILIVIAFQAFFATYEPQTEHESSSFERIEVINATDLL